jgi:hypothetical protein
MQAWFRDRKGLSHTIAGISSTENRTFCQDLGFEQRTKKSIIFTFVSVALFS